MSEPTTPSLRESLEEALGNAEPTVTSGGDLQPAEAPAPEAPAPESSEAPATDLNELAEGESRERDESGRFKAKEQKPLDDGMQPGPKSGPKVQNLERAPAAWKPDVREHWGQLPEPVRAEIARREVEVQRTLQDTAEARKTVEALQRTIAPYEAFIRAENSNPIQAIDNLMATAARLRTGTAPELATMMAQLVNQFGVGRFGQNFIDQLDNALAGGVPRAPDPQTAQVEQILNQRLAPVQQMLSQFQQAQQMQQQRVQEQAVSEVEQFLSQQEFGNDVREDMADIIEMASRRGQNLTLQQAYERAVNMNDSVRSAMSKRQQLQGMQQQTQAAQRAKAAAVSVSGAAPMGALRQEPTDIRSAIEAAIAMSSR
jgi:hypothetical protein